MEVYKGWGFVVFTAVALYLVLFRLLKHSYKETAQLAERNEELRLSRFSMDQASDAIYWINQDGSFSYVNNGACESLRYSREELLKLRLYDIDPASSPEKWEREWLRYRKKGEVGRLHFETFHRRKDGSLFPVEVAARHLWFGEHEFHVAFVRDITAPKEAEMALRESQQQMEQVTSSLQEAVWLRDARTRQILYVNPAFERISGISRENFLRDPEAFANLIHPEDKEAALAARDSCFDGRFFDKEHRIIRPDGVLRWVRGQILPIRNESGEIDRTACAVEDITERKRKEDRFKRLTECFLSFGTNPVENINRMTALCGELLGADCALYNRLEGDLLCSLGQWNTPADYVPKEKARGHICYDVLHKADNDPIVIRNLPETPYFQSDPNVARYGLKTYVGKAVHFSNSPVGSLCVVFGRDYEPDSEDMRLINIIAAAVGIEESRLQARETLRASEESYRALADNVPDVVTRIDRGLRLVYANRRLEEVLHVPVSSILGKMGVELDLPANDTWISVIQAVFDTNSPRDFEFEVASRKGARQLEVRVVPERSENGKMEFALALTRDVTERKKAEAERQHLETQLRQSQKMEAIGHLAGGVAHDFNNILTIIQGNASLLLNSELDPAEETDAAHQIVQAADRAASLTQQLLIFSRKQVMRPADVDLNEVVGNMTRMLRRILGEDIALQTNYASNPTFIHADPGMVEQVLMNLMVNARDAMSSGGQLSIATSMEDFGRPQTEKNPEAVAGPHVCLTVTDTGCGISAEDTARIFEPFFTTKEVGKGTGLGLATVYSIVQQHRGWISVASEPGKGTAFRIYLPSVKAQKPGKEEIVAATRLPRGSGTILVVEDEAPVRTLVTHLLRRCGYTVLQAETGKAALEVWKEQREKIQLLLTDIIMPDGMNGYELAQQLHTANPNLKVIYTSGYSGQMAGKGLDLVEGVNFLQKPYPSQKLLQVLQDNLNTRQTPINA